MAPAACLSVSEVKVENCTFPSTIKPPGSNNTLFLGGAGVRGIQKPGVFVKVTETGVYLEDIAISTLAPKWKGKTADELLESLEFFNDIVTGPFEKFIKVTMILPLTGEQFGEKVGENCVAIMKELNTYSEVETKAMEQFRGMFKDETFPPGASILFTQLPAGSLTIGFCKDDVIPEVGKRVIENKPLSEAFLDSVIGKDGVSPAAKKSLATRIADLFKEENVSKCDK